MSPSVRDHLQATLGTAYTLERELRGGGMSRVFVARDAALARDVVVKVLAPGVAAEVNAERFAREIRLAASLQQANIVPVLAAGESGGLPYYTMPFVDGLSLRERLARHAAAGGGPLPLAEARSVLRDVARALDYAHGRGVVHRDVKPENILLSGGAAVVTDFGIAKAVQASKAAGGDTLTSAGTSLGTPAYMAPEQAAGDAVDARADLYAWGLVAYELLAGRHPFAGRATARQLMTAQISEAPPPLGPAAPAAPRALVALVERCLAKEPAARPASAAEVLRALEDAGRATPDPRQAAAAASAAPRAAGGRRAGLALAAAALLAGGALVWGGTRAAAGPRAAAAAAAAPPAAPPAAEPAPEVRRVAVLPFENLGRPDDAYVADGVADEIRGKLAAVPGVQVIARGSSNAYRDAARAGKGPAEVAAELGVRYLLTGTVRSEPGARGRPPRVRVAPELVEVVAGSAPVSRWAASFDADLSDAFAVQADVAGRVAAAMDVALGGNARARLAAVPTRDAAAYDAYLRGRAVLAANEDPASIRRALALQTRAVALDPGFAEAWAERARVAALLYFRLTPTPALGREAREAAERALALAPDRAAGHHALGDYYTQVEKDPARAVDAYAAARRLAPGDAEVLGALAFAEQTLGRYDDALRDFRAALALDPRSPMSGRRLATALLWTRRYAEARAVADAALALAPANAALRETRAMVDLAEGDLPAARRVLAGAPAGEPRAPMLAFLATYWDLAWVLPPDDRAALAALGPDAFFGDRGQWGLVRAELNTLGGDPAAARAYGDSARAAWAVELRVSPDDAQRRVLHGLALAYAGRAADAGREAERGMALMPVARNAYAGAYVQHQAVRVYLLAGRADRALDLLEPLLRMPYYLSPAWLRIDPTFAPLRGQPRFERLAAGR